MGKAFNARLVFAAGLISAIAASIALAGHAATDPAPNALGVYGDPVAAAPYWQPQTLEDDCGLMAVADVVGQVTGDLPTEQEMVDLAVKTPSVAQSGPIYYRPGDPNNPEPGGGISMRDLVVLLGHYGINSVVTDTAQDDEVGVPTGMPALEQYLGGGRKVIAYVNSAIVWEDSENQHDDSDHFLVVTGVDTNTGYVHLNDSGADEDGANEQVKIATFMKAWDTGEDSMVVTAAAA